MTIPPQANEYPNIQCPRCYRSFKLQQLEMEETDDGPRYYCPNCDTMIYDTNDINNPTPDQEITSQQ